MIVALRATIWFLALVAAAYGAARFWPWFASGVTGEVVVYILAGVGLQTILEAIDTRLAHRTSAGQPTAATLLRAADRQHPRNRG